MNPQNPIIDTNEESIFMELIPGGVYLRIYTPGSGKTAVPGNFILLRQHTYKENMEIISTGLKSFVQGRGRLIEGL